ncbi:unnamed protein product [Peniophora sp. CBMAI 1063]|nr:unnamed protein product [Peniophora sp. CBMAI 1063]
MAIQRSKGALSLEMSVCYGIVGLCFESRFGLARSEEDIRAAVSSLNKALELIPDGHPRVSTILNNLGTAQSKLYEHTLTVIDFKAAVETFLRATSHLSGKPSIRFQAAASCVSLLSRNTAFATMDMLLSAHSRIIAILPEIVWLGHDIHRRFWESSRMGQVVNAAVAAAIAGRALSRAVEWLEAGRALIWAQVSSLRTPLDELYDAHPKLADDLRIVRTRLQTSAYDGFSRRSDSLADGTGLAGNPAADDHRKLVIEHEKLLKKIRGSPGFEDFLLPKSYNQLLTSRARLDGAVVSST